MYRLLDPSRAALPRAMTRSPGLNVSAFIPMSTSSNRLSRSSRTLLKFTRRVWWRLAPNTIARHHHLAGRVYDAGLHLAMNMLEYRGMSTKLVVTSGAASVLEAPPKMRSR